MQKAVIIIAKKLPINPFVVLGAHWETRMDAPAYELVNVICIPIVR